ncbi:response regulator transcription factor [Peribacillus simplex]|uniref:DNA-binding response regulator n=1 Tax=Peribacillus simplex NBRC 15720 = DSM 1321 TaxID=1349754 RepID=A0A223EFT1_9BACI|nr:response regulator transcription factor [Peribacillus simplex]ASS94063.1 DNA-binding response regulator [Peribacillus simplex NBRC 15720 = DSM 1321]MEC1400407.1 response regulator transcription factor [Peribacillus simplex]MED3908649.1 response regulator transcription factor [Peribacillus simplex]MED3983663.1 response regulator transcription factor [Peribacillus simplex]MED4093671.1 response regulator transcription factor [Peribacillus simplex]
MSNDQWILIIDDEEDLARLMETVLHKEGIPNIVTAGTIADGWVKFQKFHPSLVLLDIMLPDGEGYDLCKQIREVSNVPILFLSAKDEEIDKLLGLAIGGDDYITKPFSPKEVAYRVKAQLRRAGFSEEKATPKKFQVGPFELSANENEVKKDGKTLELTAKEIGLMSCFMHHPNQILSKETLFEHVWGDDFFGSDNTVMVHIRRLREKIEADPSKPSFLITVKGLGYKLQTKGESR